MARTRPPFAAKPAIESLDKVARELRLEVITLSHQAKTPLPGTALSCIELLIALYWNTLRIDPNHPEDPNRDRLIFNKSNAISALYVVLARRGFLPAEELKQYNKEGCRLAQHPAPGSIPGLEWSTSQPGQGLGVATGIALAAKTLQRTHKTCILLDAREYAESAIRASAKIAAQLRLGNLTALIETAPADDSSATDSPAAQWKSCGWETLEMDGHDLVAIGKILQQPRTSESPLALLARTNPGLSLASASNNPWASRPPTADEVETARKELGL